MKNLTTIRDASSLLAGFLIGVSIVIAVLAMTVADPGGGLTVWVILAPIVLALGFILQSVVTGGAAATQGQSGARSLAFRVDRIEPPGSLTIVAPPQSDGRSETLADTSLQHKTAILRCSSCGALLAVLPDMTSFACKYCAAEHIAVRRDGTTALRRVAEAI